MIRSRLATGLAAAAALWAGAAFSGGAPAGDAPLANQWNKVDEGKTGERVGSVFLYAPDSKQMFLIGGIKNGPYVQAFDPAARTWSDFSAAAPTRDGINPYYQAAYDPVTRTVYCLSGGPVMYSLSVADRTWKTHPAAAALDGMSWHAMACDPAGRRLVVVGADKKIDNLGWMRTVVYDIPSGTWARPQVADAKATAERRDLVAAREAAIDLVGRVRLAWYRDPQGVGTAAELASLADRCGAIRKLPQMDRFAADVEAVAALVAGKRTLDALGAARGLQRRIEDAAEAGYPVPPSRRNSPLVFEPRSKVFVLFGGDHEDYMMNDTWVLDLDKKASPWRRARPDVAPSPRAGHALCALAGGGKVALWEGYVQSSSPDYGAGPWTPVSPLQLWLYDPKSDRWDLAGSWRPPGRSEKGAAPSPAGPGAPGPVGVFYGYFYQAFSPPALAADADDTLVLAAHACDRWGGARPCQTWTLRPDPAASDAAGRGKLGAAPDSRLYRTGRFLASWCEVAEPAKDTGLEKLPANRWVRLPAPPRNPCYGCRQRDWGTSTWDSDRDQVLLWGGGHCVRSASTVAHYSPASGRIVEGFDADEPYSANGSGGFDSSVMGRPWVSVHNYHHYAYDPKCRLMVSARGYLYDPDRMDWVRMEPIALPYKFAWDTTVVASSPHGAVAWAQRRGSEEFGLWLYDRAKGWADLEQKGRLFAPYCDAHGMVYDAKRDRMIFGGAGGGYAKLSSGRIVTFDFKSRAVETLTPENPEIARTHNAREMAYVDHADWVLIGEMLVQGDPKTGARYTRVYDCGKNKMFLLDAGKVPDGYSTGWMYDARRRLVYVFTVLGEAWAIRIEPATAMLLEKAE